MPEFTKGEVSILLSSVASFTASFEKNVVEVLQTQFRGAQPAEVNEVREQLSLLAKQLGIAQRQGALRIHDAHNPLLKRIVIDERRRCAEAIDLPLQKAIDPQLIKHLHREVRPLEEMMTTPWFLEARALRLPRLTDYISIRFAENALADKLVLHPREYDEKFHILEAPALFLPDLGYYRTKCSFRGAPIAVAYVDIDDFKAINTRYTETVVDLKLLAPFMEMVEAHVFGHGHAYRFGGDEYVLLLPNMGPRWAVEFLRELSAKVAAATYPGLEVRVGISSGTCDVDVDCFLTDREVLAKANLAKNFVKSRGKGRIASYEGTFFREDELVLR